ncbi:unnamed protein product [Orchesella dallaii]|uniref:Uncharacterized protein n=1 Tax=Orchesella dallaii TaxID=48710 RepID=A0ABP1S9T0_9HEXA
MIQQITPGLTKQWVGPWWKYGEEYYVYPKYLEYSGLEGAKSFNSTLSDLAIYTDLKEILTLDWLSAKAELTNTNKAALAMRSLLDVRPKDEVKREIQATLKRFWGIKPPTENIDLNKVLVRNQTSGDVLKTFL